jgi:CDP-diglyceride synthetase
LISVINFFFKKHDGSWNLWYVVAVFIITIILLFGILGDIFDWFDNDERE